MKKLCSLLLALVMTVSLFAVAPSDAEAAFTDANSITYKEAVDIISALGIVGGYNDGSFRPVGLLTRGAAAKIICSMSLTPTIANQMSNNTATRFKDVPAGHTFAGYITWCVQEGIVSGYSDNTFHPGDPLTVQAFLKMLLGALGYDQTIEHYTGSGWSNNVTSQALMIGLNNGLTKSLNGAEQVTRQDACLFAFNTLKANLVEYTGTRNTRVDKTSGSATRAISIVNEGAAPYTVQFAEQYYPDLKQTANTTDAFGCPATKWAFKNTEIGSYLAADSYVYYNEDVTLGTVYRDLALSATAPLTFYVNGVDVTKTGAVIARNDTTKLSECINPATPQAIGNGVEIRAFRTTRNDAPAVVLSAVVYYPGTVASVRSATNSSSRRITITGLGTGDVRTPAGLDGHNSFETEDFDTGDIVAYTFSNMPGQQGIQSVVPLNTVRGNVNRVISGVSLDINNVTYQNALNIVYGNAAGQETDLVVGNPYTLYLLILNNKELALWVENVQASSGSYAWVKDISEGRLNFDYAKASLVFANGTEQVVSLDVYDTGGSFSGKIVTYSIDNNGRYNLKPVATAYAADVTVQSRTATGMPEGITADNSTTFIVQDAVAKTYQVYKGMRTMPNVKNGAAYVYSEDNVAVMVFINNATITTSRTELVFIAANSASNLIRGTSDTSSRTFNAVVDGQITKVSVRTGSTLGNDKSGAQFTVAADNNAIAADNSVILDNTEYNADGMIIGGGYTNASVSVGRARGFSDPSGTTAIRLGTNTGRGTLMDLSASVNVYNVSTTGAISRINISNVKADSSAWVYYTIDSNDIITNLFILKTQ